jgi:hypothetical protein
MRDRRSTPAASKSAHSRIEQQAAAVDAKLFAMQDGAQHLGACRQPFVFEGIGEFEWESPLPRRSGRAPNFGRQVMANLARLGIAAVLSIVFASSTPARAVIHNSGTCPRASTASGDAPPPSVGIPRGCETSTRPWSAPVGHRQPQADIPPSISFDQSLDQENAKIDRVISGVCRGC